jgi:hypothetical protein
MAALDSALRAGQFAVSFVGHGSPYGGWLGRSGWLDPASLSASTSHPVLMMTACLTGKYTDPGCVGNKEVLSRGGPIGVIGASEVSMPTDNAAWAEAITTEVVAGRQTRLGDAFLEAQERFQRGDLSASNRLVRGVGNFLASTTSVVREADDAQLYLYNLLGDSATELRRPLAISELEVHHERGSVHVSGKLPAGAESGQAELVVLSDTAPGGVLLRRSFSVSDGRLELSFDLPREQAKPPLRNVWHYRVRIAVVGSAELAVAGRDLWVPRHLR